MSNIFLLTTPIEDVEGFRVHGMSDELKSLYIKTLELINSKPEIIEKLTLSQYDGKSMKSLLSAMEFVDAMKCLEEAVDIVALENVIKSNNVELWAEYLREIISPKNPVSEACQKHYCDVLKAFMSLLPEEVSMFKEVCEASIRMYSQEK